MLERILEEQETVLKGDPSTPLTWEHLGEMELLHNCMRETLRMYPPLVCEVYRHWLLCLTLAFRVNKQRASSVMRCWDAGIERSRTSGSKDVMGDQDTYGFIGGDFSL